MVITKNQIRPRRKKFHFNNAEILTLFDTVGVVQLIAPLAPGFVFAIEGVQMRVSITQVYTAIDPGCFIQIEDDFGSGGIIANDGAKSPITRMFGFGGLACLINWPGMELFNDASDSVIPPFGFHWTDEAEIAAFGGIILVADNGGADFADGDPLNYVDFFLDYKIINLN